jgi:hypothetical protein
MQNQTNQCTTGGELSPGRVHELLAKQRRRHLLYCLYLSADPVSLPDAAARVTEREHDGAGDDLLDERSRVYTSLYHSHVPKLADADVVTYSQSEDMVELSSNVR